MIGDKKYFLLIAIVLILISIGGVWASDNSTVDSVAAEDSGSADVDESPLLASDASVKENITVENNDEPASAVDSESGEVLGASNDEDVLGRGLNSLSSDISRSGILTYDYSGGSFSTIEITKDIIPNRPTILSGFVEKLIMPSAANLSIFFNGYLVFPANLSFRSYSNANCLNPIQLHNPLKNLLCSGRLFITSTTFLSTNLKSPVSFGISTSDKAFKVL